MLRGGSTDFDFILVKGDDYPTFTMTLYEQDNETPIDISLASTTVTLTVKKPDGNYIELENVSKISDGKGGMVYHQWSSDEVDIVGVYEVQARIFFQNRRYTCLNRVRFQIIDSLRGN